MKYKSWEEINAALLEPFSESVLSWRAGSTSRDKKRAQALAYAEPRAYEDRLNEVLGPHWERSFTVWGDQRIVCTITIHMAGDQDDPPMSVRRSSSGEFDSGDKIAQGTTAEAQAFKRACSAFGLGSYLYKLPAAWVPYDETHRRLLEVPALPNWAKPSTVTMPSRNEPKPAAAATKAAKPANTGKAVGFEEEPKHDPVLSDDRAKAMVGELHKLDYDKAAACKLAEDVLGWPVTDFSSLTESQALLIWQKAKSTPREAEQKPNPNNAIISKGRAESVAKQLAEKGYREGSAAYKSLVERVLSGKSRPIVEMTVAEAQLVWSAAASPKVADA